MRIQNSSIAGKRSLTGDSGRRPLLLLQHLCRRRTSQASSGWSTKTGVSPSAKPEYSAEMVGAKPPKVWLPLDAVMVSVARRCGVTLLESAEAAPVPLALVAVTLNR